MLTDTVLVDGELQNAPEIAPVTASDDTVVANAIDYSPVVALLTPTADTVEVSLGATLPVVDDIQAVGDTVVAEYVVPAATSGLLTAAEQQAISGSVQQAVGSVSDTVTTLSGEVTALFAEIAGVNSVVAQNNAAADTAFAEVKQSVVDNNNAADAAFAQIRGLVNDNNTAANSTFTQVQQAINDNKTAADATFTQLLSSIADNVSAIGMAQGQISDAFTELGAISQTVSSVKSTVDGNSAAITVQQGALSTLSMSLSGQITTLSANLGQTNANVTSEQLARTTADQAITANYLTLQSTVGDNYASANNQFFTITTNLSALSTNYTQLKAATDGNAAALVQESSARATGDSTNATAITSLDTKFTSGLATTNANVTQEVNARTDAVSSLAGSINSYTTSFNSQLASTQASVTAETAARSSADQAITTQYNTLNAQVNDPTTGLPKTVANLQSEQVTRANADMALTTSYTTLSAQVNNPTTGLPGIAASVTSEASARASADMSLSGRIDTQTTNYNNLSSSLTQESATRSSADQTLAGQYTSLSSSYNTLASNQAAGSGGGNQFPNSELNGYDGWYVSNGGGARATLGFNNPSYSGNGVNVIYAVDPNYPNINNGDYFDILTPLSPCTGGALYEYSIYAAYHRAITCQIRVAYYDATGAFISYSPAAQGGVSQGAGGGLLTNFQRIGGFVTAPVTAVRQQLNLRLVPDGEQSPYSWFTKPYVGIATPGQTQLSPYSPGTQANVPGLMASLTSESVTRASADSALSTSYTNLAAQVNNPTTGLPGISASVTSEASARAAADSSLSGRIDTQTSNYNNLSSSLTQEAATRSSADQTLAGQYSTLNSQINDPNTGLPQTVANLSSEQVTRANADSAISTSVTNLQASFAGGSGGGNDLANSELNGNDGWSFVSSVSGATNGLNLNGYYSPTAPVNVLWSNMPGTPSAGNINYWFSPSMPAQGGVVYEFSAFAAFHRAAYCEIVANFYDASGNYVGGRPVGTVGGLPQAQGGAGGGALTNFQQIGGFITSPAGTAYRRIILLVIANGSDSNPYGFFTHPQSRIASPNQTALSPYQPGTQANVAAITASLYNESVTRANADSAMATNIQTLSTNQGNDHASISTLTSSVNGLSVQFAVVGTIDNNSGSPTYGGFIFSGVKQANGTVTYNTVFNSNVVINGSLVVTGTTPKSALTTAAQGDLATPRVTAYSLTGGTGNSPFSSASGSGVFTVPAGIYWIDVEIWGAGSGSLSYQYITTVQNSGEGGGSQQVSNTTYFMGSGGGYFTVSMSVNPGDKINYTIGAGGQSAAFTNGNISSTGGTTKFGTTIQATGGQVSSNGSVQNSNPGVGSGPSNGFPRSGTISGGTWKAPPCIYGPGQVPGGGAGGDGLYNGGDGLIVVRY